MFCLITRHGMACHGMACYVMLLGLYMCSSGTHPGGGVMGAPGRNSARVVLSDLGVRSQAVCQQI